MFTWVEVKGNHVGTLPCFLFPFHGLSQICEHRTPLLRHVVLVLAGTRAIAQEGLSCSSSSYNTRTASEHYGSRSFTAAPAPLYRHQATGW